MASQNKLRDDLIEHLEQGIARASEAQDAIKFSESLVRREIHLTRLQLDIQLNKLETRTQFELRQTVERETKTVQHIIEQLSNIIKRVKSQDIPEAELEMVASDIEELLGFIKRKKIKFHESSDINTIFEGQENFGSFSITTISPGPRVTVPCNQFNISSNDEIQCKQTTNVGANSSEENSQRETHRSILRSSKESCENKTVDDERDSSRYQPFTDHQPYDRSRIGSASVMSLSDSDVDLDSSSSPTHEDGILNDIVSQSSPSVHNVEVTDPLTDSYVRVGDTSDNSNVARQTGERCFIKNTSYNITTDTDDEVPSNRHCRGRSRSFGSSHHGLTDGSLTSSTKQFENGSINRTVLKPSPRRSLRSDSSKDANPHKNDDNSVNTDIRHFRRTCEISDSEQDNNSNVSHDVIHLRRQNDMNENKWAFGRQSRINNTRLNSVDSNEYEDNTSRFDSDEFDDYYDQDDIELDQEDYDNAYISRSERVEKANREWFGDRTRGDSRSLTRQRSRSASPRSARLRSHGKTSYSSREDSSQPRDMTDSSVKVSTSCVEEHRQDDGLISNIEHLTSDQERGQYRVELESDLGRRHVENEEEMTIDTESKGWSAENNEPFDTTLEPNEKPSCEREMHSHQTIHTQEGFKSGLQDDNDDTDVGHYNKACDLITDESLLISSRKLDNCEDENNKEIDGDANVEKTSLATNDELFEVVDDASEISDASSPNSISSCCVALNEDAVVDHDVKPANPPAEQTKTSEGHNAQRNTKLKLKRMRNRSINDNIDSLFKSQGLDNARCTGDVDAKRDQQRIGNVDMTLDAKKNDDNDSPCNDSSGLALFGGYVQEDIPVNTDDDAMQELAQSDFVSHYCTIRRKRKGDGGKTNMSQLFQQSDGSFATSNTDRILEKTIKTNGPVTEGLSDAGCSAGRSKTVHHNKSKLPSFNEMLYS